MSRRRDGACPDGNFGPWAGPDCRGGFDFTLLFEETILSILLSAVFLCLTALDVASCLKAPTKIRAHAITWVKLTLVTGLVALSAAALGIHATEDDTSQTSTTVPSAALVLVASIAFAVLSTLKQRASLRPSLLITAYLSLSVLLDVARARTLWLSPSVSTSTRSVLTASLALRALILLLESTEKRSYLLPEYRSVAAETTSGPINTSLFWWLNPLFLRGYRSLLDYDHLGRLDEELDSERLGVRLRHAWRNVEDQKKPNALFGAWLSAFQGPILLPAFARLFQIGFTFAQPFLVTAAIRLAALPQQEPYNNLGYGLIGAYILVYGGIAISVSQSEWRAWRAATMMRGSVVPLIHDKAVVLDSSTHTGLSHMGALTLISTDIETIVSGLTQLHETWSNVVELALSIYLLERQLGVSCVMSIGFSLVVMVGTGFLAVPTGTRQALWNQASQERVAATSHTLGSVKWIKISGLTDIAFSALRNLRAHELQVSERFRWLLGGSLVLSLSTPILGPLLTFATAAGVSTSSNSGLSIAQIFTAFSIMVLLNSPLTKLVIALPQIAGAVTSFQRIQDFLNAQEYRDVRGVMLLDGEEKGGASVADKTNYGGRAMATMRGAFFWSGSTPEMGEESREKVDSKSASEAQAVARMEHTSPTIVISSPLRITRNTLTVIMGPVGCGKSSLLRALLGELSVQGEVSVGCAGPIAFCEQSPWLPNETVHQLVTGRLPSDTGDKSTVDVSSKLSDDDDWYRTVLRACRLERDIETWPRGEETRVGSKGITMSGGQKQRLSLARAIYARRELLLLDDSFSGIDASTEDALFMGLLGHNGLLRSANMTTIMTSSSSRPLLPLGRVIKAPVANIRLARVLAFADRLITMNQEGHVTDMKDLHTAEGDTVASEILEKIDRWAAHEAHEDGPRTAPAASRGDGQPETELMTTTEAQADAARQVGDASVYKYYAKAAGYRTLVGFVVAMSVFAFCDAFPSIWLKWWAEANEDGAGNDLGKWFGVYTLLCVGALVSCFIGMWQLFILAINKTASQFHEILLHAVSHAPIAFHATTDTGTTINRFSQDLQLIDMELPPAAMGVTMSTAFGFAQFILVCVSSRYLSILVPFLILAFYLLGHFYLRTARQLRQMTIDLKAPLYTHFMQTLTGMVSIRAFGWQDRSAHQNILILDKSQRPNYLLYCAQRWLTLAVNIIIMLVAIALIVVVTNLREAIGPGYVGVALSNILAFSFTVQAIITSWVQLEVSLGAVARIKTFAKALPSEDDVAGLTESTGDIAESSWPPEGQVSIRNLSASYSPSAKVLDNVSLEVEAGQKVCICGRTGSGKSSLFLSLLGLVEQDSGSIFVDGVDLAALPREYLRSRIVAIPQEAYILPGSVRFNIDAHHQHESTATDGRDAQRDHLILEALDKVGMRHMVEAREGGLDAAMDENTFSQGQMQLLMLARAMMRQTGGRLLLIDEATSSLDQAASAKIDEVIKTSFANWTVLAIVHKLEVTLDYDKVVVLDAGQVLEFDEPRALLARPSVFKKLYESSTEG
ncbi:Leucinostatins biosynthesis cluster protein H [Emericellopsis cladophorae]|uniref:Leucinostatins biosynthesis cluster protein H n=1 Tax=Emericellopsis cladophorae TaxID=2686198 RepID=A0A9Q0BF30_9HYPO|nr:Leucinostatins biosynthesis cluster protein H [Emericellopsis cladophorae]KAI6782255.1 Leucinostatins biosynthesis cluster protein H [Emericellopsis cladophorae]